MAARTLGPYRLDRLLGVGGMGEVHLAYDQRRDRMVALKLLPEALSRDPEYQQRFRRESHVAARLRDPHVVPIHDYGEIDGHLYIDMRLVEGRNIRQILDDDGPLSPARAVHLCGQAAMALEAAHADGLVHRDVKPSNLLVTDHDFVYVVDFGIARSVGTAGTALTLTGVTVGTLDYMAPERFSGRTVNGRADVYSLACLLYECLTGRAPFAGEDLPTLMYAHLFSDAPRPSLLVEGLPVEMDEVIRHGMAKELEDRIATPTQLVQAARVALNGPGEGVAATASVAVPTVRERVAVGPTPGYLEIAPNGRFAYIANRDARVVTVLDLTINQVTARIPIPAGPPQFVTFSPDGTRAYLSIYDEPGTIHLIGVLDTATNSWLGAIPVGRRPYAAATTQDGGRLYVPSHDDGRLDVIDTAAGAVVAEIPVAPNPHWVAFSADGTRLFTANHESNLVSMIDVATSTVLATTPVGTSPHSTAVSPDGAVVAVVNFDSNEVSILDATTAAVLATVPVGDSPQDVAFAGDGRYLYTTDVRSDTVSVVDTRSKQVSATIPAGDGPTSVAVTPDGTRGYVTCLYSGEVLVLDLTAS